MVVNLHLKMNAMTSYKGNDSLWAGHYFFITPSFTTFYSDAIVNIRDYLFYENEEIKRK